MAKFRKGEGKETPGMNTASLPDIVFMLLFFFMVITTMKDSDTKVRTLTPSASEVEKLELKSFVHTILVGPPTKNYQKQYGTTPRIQLNDEIAQLSDINEFIVQERAKAPDGSEGILTTSIKADKEEVKMGIITDVKQELRKVSQLKVSYYAIKGKKLVP